MSHSEHTYENFAKCFAGIYRKHFRHRHASAFTCYVRDGIEAYIHATADRRQRKLEFSAAEDLCGARIAKALLDQGWPTSKIDEFNDDMQQIVNRVERYNDFLDRLDNYYRATGDFERRDNELRFMWAMDGAPDISTDEDDNDPDDVDDDDDY